MVPKEIAEEFTKNVAEGTPLSEMAKDHLRSAFQIFKARRKKGAPVILFSEFSRDYIMDNMTGTKVRKMEVLADVINKNPPHLVL